MSPNLPPAPDVEARVRADLRWGIRRPRTSVARQAGLLVALVLLAVAVLVSPLAPPSGAQDDPPRRELPGTELEAEERDDGTTSAAPWVIGSGIAAVVLIGVGGALLSRAGRREDGPDRP